jgi:hypothetical protein
MAPYIFLNSTVFGNLIEQLIYVQSAIKKCIGNQTSNIDLFLWALSIVIQNKCFSFFLFTFLLFNHGKLSICILFLAFWRFPYEFFLILIVWLLQRLPCWDFRRFFVDLWMALLCYKKLAYIKSPLKTWSVTLI